MSICATQASWKLTKQQVSATEKLLLLSISDRASEQGICWPSLKRLAADTCLDIKTVKEGRQSLIRKGLLEYTGEYKGRSKQIPVMRLTFVKFRHEDDEFEQILNETDNGPGKNLNEPKNGLGRQAQKRTPESINKNLKENNPSIVSLKEDMTDFSNQPKKKKNKIHKNDELFYRFYEAYPRKAKPQDARKAFNSIVGVDLELLDKILNDLEKRSKEHKQWQDKQFIPYPATYLRSHDWESEIIELNPESGKKEVNAKEIEQRQKLQEEYTQRKAKELLFNQKVELAYIPTSNKNISIGSPAVERFRPATRLADLINLQGMEKKNDREGRETYAF